MGELQRPEDALALLTAVREDWPQSVDHTTLSDFMVCRRRGYWRHIIGIKLVSEAMPLKFGAHIHLGLQAYYETRDVGEAIKAFERGWKDSEMDDKRTASRARKMLVAYDRKYRAGLDEWQVVGQEIVAARGLKTENGTIPYIFRNDMVVRSPLGMWVVDFKTTSSFSALTVKSLNPNHQFQGYCWGAKATTGEAIQGLIYDGLLVAKTKEDFLRDYVRYEPWELELWQLETSRLVTALAYACEEARNSKDTRVWHTQFPRNPMMCCHYYGECPYRSLCVCEPRDEALAVEMVGRYTHSVWNPLVMEEEG